MKKLIVTDLASGTSDEKREYMGYDRWWAWCLLPGWKADNWDIGWAEAVGMEFLIITLLSLYSEGSCIKIFGDNWGVVEGWWKGRSHNKVTNTIFKQIHELSASAQCTFFTCYIPVTVCLPYIHFLIPMPLTIVLQHDHLLPSLVGLTHRMSTSWYRSLFLISLHVFTFLIR